MHKQIDYFKEYQQRLSALIGVSRTKRLVNQALILITVGGNDFVNNYFLVDSTARSRQYSLPDYVKFLINRYSKHLQVYKIKLSSLSKNFYVNIYTTRK